MKKWMICSVLMGSLAVVGYAENGGSKMSAEEIAAFEEICSLVARDGKDVSKVVASVKERELDRTIKLSKLLEPDSLSYFLATFATKEARKNTFYGASRYGGFSSKKHNVAITKSDEERVALINKFLTDDKLLCSMENIRNLVWNDKDKIESSGTFCLESEDLGVSFGCSFRAKKINGKLRINEVFVELRKKEENLSGDEENRVVSAPVFPLKVLDRSWKINGLSLAQREALDSISRLETVDGIEIGEVFKEFHKTGGR